jgi:hypothetical protein
MWAPKHHIFGDPERLSDREIPSFQKLPLDSSSDRHLTRSQSDTFAIQFLRVRIDSYIIFSNRVVTCGWEMFDMTM